MALKASQTRIVKKKYLIGFVLLGTMVHCIIMFWFFWLQHEDTPLFAMCINDKENHEIGSPSLFLPAITIIVTGSGLFCDIKMLLFVKSQNKAQPAQLVPWKSISLKNVDEDQKVPLRATMISATSLISLLIMRIIVVSSQVIDDNLFWILSEMLLLWGALNMPFMLMLTVKRKTKGPTVQSKQPPQNLQFHDEANEIRGISEPLQFHEDFAPDDVREDCNKATTDQELEIVEVHQEPQNPGIPHSGLNSTISIVGAMDQTNIPNPLDEYQNRQRCHNVQNLSNLHVPAGNEDPNEIACVERVTIISD